MATYKGKACKVVRTNGKHKTIRFNTTGSEMTVTASRISTAKKKNPRRNAKKKNPASRVTVRRNAKKKNPYVSFAGHGRNKGRVGAGKRGKRPVARAKVTFFVHKTRAKGKRVSAAAPKGYSVIGTKSYKSKAAYTAALKKKWSTMPAKTRAAAVKKFRAAVARGR
jgi:hypothetical protein